jgi:ABC-2 type transport system ATP-binding protein
LSAAAAPAARTGAAAVAVRGLAKSYGARRAVGGLDFEVLPGELFGLVGPDGAGKTTTLRMLAGVLAPSGGDAEIDGVSVARDPEAVKPHLAYMSQRFGLYADLTVEENLDFYADLYRVPADERAERLARLYAFSNLEPFRDRLAGALSGGMKQKLGLSCALVHRPRVLLLDEPTFGVDPVSRRDLWRIVHEMVAQGVTAIVATAYLDEAERFDRVAFLDEGELLSLDSPQGLIASFPGELLEVRAADLGAARAAVERLAGVSGAASFGDRLHVAVDSAADRRAALEAALAEAGVGGAGVERVTPGLEDVFLERIARRRRGSPAPPAAGPEAGSRQVREARGGEAPAVEVEGLTRRFGAFVAVDGVSFSVAPGEVFGFLGPNGAGKTTLIKMLTGLLAPSAGWGRVAGLDVVGERPRIRESAGYMSQLFSLYGDLTVAENLGFFGGLYGVEPGRLERRKAWALAMAGLEGEQERLTRDLALGWKQRLALGCAVLHEPAVLFLDEPTSGVDPISRRRFWALIHQLAGAGTTVFVTTHYLEEAEYCHRLALMNRGRLIALDTPAALKRATGEPHGELVVDRPLEALSALEAAAGVVRAALFGRALHVVLAGRDLGPEAIAGRLAELGPRLAAAGVRVASARPIEPSLEDVFVALVERAGGAVVG